MILAGVISVLLAKNVIARVAMTRSVNAIAGVGLKVREVHVGLLNTRIRIRGLQLLNPKGFHEPLMVNMPELVVDYRLGALITGKTRLDAVRMDLRELVVVRNEQGFVNLDALRAVQVSRAHNKANSARPLRPASPPPSFQVDQLELAIGTVIYRDYTVSPPLIREFPVNVHERFAGVTDPHALGALVISRALAKTTVVDLAKLDLKPLQAQIASAVERSLGKVIDGVDQHQLAIAARTKRVFGF